MKAKPQVGEIEKLQGEACAGIKSLSLWTFLAVKGLMRIFFKFN